MNKLTVQWLTLIMLVLVFWDSAIAQADIPELKLAAGQSVLQLDEHNLHGKNRFDLSGIAMRNDSVFVIADKPWNKAIYLLTKTKTGFDVSIHKELPIPGRCDLEGLAVLGQTFYLSDESENRVFRYANNQLEIFDPLANTKLLSNEDWRNKSFEGIAVSNTGSGVFLAKERENRHLLRYDFETDSLRTLFEDFSKTTGLDTDFTDIQYLNGYLYVLQRNIACVSRIDVWAGTVKTVSFKQRCNPNGKRLYVNDTPQYGMAEALLITDNKIWIGFDNNGDLVSEYGVSVGLKTGNEPLILIFDRPKLF